MALSLEKCKIRVSKGKRMWKEGRERWKGGGVWKAKVNEGGERDQKNRSEMGGLEVNRGVIKI